MIIKTRYKGEYHTRRFCSDHWPPRKHRLPYLDYNGYVMVWDTEKTRFDYESRVVVQRVIGRALTSTEIVKHIDGVKSNNAIDNLEVHQRGIKVWPHVCPNCGFDLSNQ